MVKYWVGILGCAICSGLINYFSIREILYSIVWAKRGGKYRRFKAFVREHKKEQSFFSRVSMRYLAPHAGHYQSTFIVWWEVKRFYALFTAVISLTYLVSGLLWRQTVFFYVLSIAVLLVSIISFILVRIQFGADGHTTKYDSYRIRKKK